MAEWHFNQQQLGDSIREPIHGEFFSNDAVSKPGQSLIREGIQNSLDAKSDTGGRVLVRIYYSGGSGINIGRFVDEGWWRHCKASGNGLSQEDVPSRGDQCRFVAFEDFSTRGLEGDPDAYPPPGDGKNHFYHFFRAEGQSDKDSSNRGIWGVGKHVFFRASQTSTIFGLTVRNDGRRLLMGKSILRTHSIGQKRYQDGYFGVRSRESARLMLPVEEPAVLNAFTELFGLQRGHDDPGLSLVVPWPDRDITDRAIISAVLRDYFYPILNDELQVIVETPSVKIILDKNSLLGEIGKLDEEISRDLQPLIELADWSFNPPKRFTACQQDTGSACQWSQKIFSDEDLNSLKENYSNGVRLAVRVPLNVRKKGGGSTKSSFFDIYLVRDKTEKTGRPTFIRDGIIISDVRASRARGVRSIVVACDPPLAGFLRKAENPAHTQWNSSSLKKEYKSGVSDLEFVTGGVHHLVQILTKDDHEKDPRLLEEFFSIPAQEWESDLGDEPGNLPVDPSSVTAQVMEAGGDESGNLSVDPPPPSSQPFRIEKIDGGFSILPGDKKLRPPAGLDVNVAYDVRRGNPLKKYNVEDFRIQEGPIAFNPDPRNAEIVEKINNHLEIKINDPDFAVSVVGFDQSRQLYVEVKAK